MVKIFVGNLPRPTTAEEIRALFEKYGEVSECDLIKNYGFVHMDNKEAAKEAIENLHHYKLHGVAINVEASKSMTKSSTKLHVGKVSPNCTSQELQAKFEEYGTVLECDIIKDYAFVHMERGEDAMAAIKGLDGTELKGKRIHVELSKSRLRVQPGMGEKNTCFRCGKDGHWSKECPADRQEMGLGFAHDYLDPYAMHHRYGEQPFYDSRYVDYYEKYRAGAYGAVGTPYPDRWGTPMAGYGASMRERMPKALEAYSQSSISQPPTYYTRDRSPLRRPTASTITDYATAATEYAAAAAAAAATNSDYGAATSTAEYTASDYAAAAASYAAQDYASANYATGNYAAATTTADYASANYSASDYAAAAAAYAYDYGHTMSNSGAYSTAGTTAEAYADHSQYSAY
ncbi:RNA-binding protein 4B-like [Chiloscyllium punctatum]|uniref:RNA-binding protein 4B-like n=1 Tax=Chiloscyllium plagiosum TaxID=36176 RepID=UPI001CB80CAB|nr:RNA-binding protein 4B-like [Chiloscyllium plagiosum]XP_043533980.1 RNA-binding protein 4B-like [Chiloscyllium plagiosum]